MDSASQYRPRCEGECVPVEAPADPPHYGKIICDVCGRFIQWLPKPDREKVPRPNLHRELAIKFGRGVCVLCGKTRAELKAIGRWLVGHHVYEYQRPEVKQTAPTPATVWEVCNACHEWIHFIRKHHGNPKGPPPTAANEEQEP